MSLSGLFKYLRFKPFDLSTESGRNSERYRLALWSVIANVGSKGITMAVMVLSVSMTLPYLGAERFGVWMTIASLVGMLVFLDLGVGNALINTVAAAAAKAQTSTDPAPLAQTIGGGLGLLFFVGILASALLAVLAAVLPWADIIKVNDPLITPEIQSAMFVFAGLFGINLFSSGVLRVFAGLQRAFEAHLASVLASLVSLAALFYVAGNQGSITQLLLATLGCQSTAGLFLLLLLKHRRQVQLAGLGKAIQDGKGALLRSGGLFLVLQLGAMVGWGADSLIISSTLGAAQVAAYSVTQRLFQFVSVPLSIVNAPLWAAYANANASGDLRFIRRTLQKSLLITSISATLAGAILFGLGQQLLTLWTGGVISVPPELILVFAIWTLCEAMGNALAMMLNGCGIVREQVITVLTLTTLALPAKVFFVLHFGVVGMMAVYVFLYLATVCLFYGLVYRKVLLKKLGRP